MSKGKNGLESVTISGGETSVTLDGNSWDRFVEKAKAAAGQDEENEISEAEDAREIGEELIPQYHQHLQDARILYLFTTKKRTKNGKLTLATASKATSIMRFIGRGVNFVLLFGKEEWKDLTYKQRVALVDHELCHCEAKYTDDGEREWTIRGHDVEEFSEVVERHGLWLSDLREMAHAIEQLSLPMNDAA